MTRSSSPTTKSTTQSSTPQPHVASPAAHKPKLKSTPHKSPRLKNISTSTLRCIFYLLWAAAALLVPQYLLYLPLHFLLGPRLQDPLWLSLHNSLSYALSAFLILFLPHRLLRKARDTRESLGLSHLPQWSDILLAPIGFVIYAFSATILTGLFSKFPFFNTSEPQQLGYNSLALTSDKIIVFMVLSIVAPLVEELIFRGWLYGKLRAEIKGRASLPLSVFLTSLLFALLHGQWNVGVNVFCLSVVLCLLREITGTIHSGILLHILKNAIAFYLLYML